MSDDKLTMLLAAADRVAFEAKQFIEAIKEGDNRRAHTKMIYLEIELDDYAKRKMEYQDR